MAASQQPTQLQQQQQRSIPQTQPPLTKVHYFHDSNSDDKFMTNDDIQYAIDTINKKQNKQQTKYDIHKHATYELQQTLNKITHTTFHREDIVLINILTNDSRTTNRRPPKSLRQTEYLLTSILDHLLSRLPPSNIVLLESPPLLYEDIFPYAELYRRAAAQRRIRYAPTLIGEAHVKRWDGVHLTRGSHRLLTNAVACAVLNQNPHRLFGYD